MSPKRNARDRFRPLDSGLLVPDWMPEVRRRRRVESKRGLIFTPGSGGCGTSACHCEEECDPDCGLCQDCPTPQSFYVEVSGVTWEGSTGCGDFNSAWTADIDTGPSAPNRCTWDYTNPGNIPSLVEVAIAQSGSDITLTVTLKAPSDACVATFIKTYTSVSEIDCELSSESIPYDSETGTSCPCDFSSATCLVTAL